MQAFIEGFITAIWRLYVTIFKMYALLVVFVLALVLIARLTSS